MCFEVFLKIIVAILAFFGVFCFVKLVGIVWFGYDNLRVTVEVDSPDTAKNIDLYIKEAESTCLAVGGREVAVLVRSEYSTETLISKLEKKRVKYYIINQNNTEVK